MKFWITYTIIPFLVIALLFGALTVNIVKTDEYKGKVIEFVTSDKYFVEVSSEGLITIEAVSSEFLAMWNPDGSNIVGMPSQKPLGWTEDQYFLAKEDDLMQGTWMLENGYNITMRFTSSEDMVVRNVLKPEAKVIAIALFSILGFCCWLVILSITEPERKGLYRT